MGPASSTGKGVMRTRFAGAASLVTFAAGAGAVAAVAVTPGASGKEEADALSAAGGAAGGRAFSAVNSSLLRLRFISTSSSSVNDLGAILLGVALGVAAVPSTPLVLPLLPPAPLLLLPLVVPPLLLLLLLLLPPRMGVGLGPAAKVAAGGACATSVPKMGGRVQVARSFTGSVSSDAGSPSCARA
jgi:hypothetical protein